MDDQQLDMQKCIRLIELIVQNPPFENHYCAEYPTGGVTRAEPPKKKGCQHPDWLGYRIRLLTRQYRIFKHPNWLRKDIRLHPRPIRIPSASISRIFSIRNREPCITLTLLFTFESVEDGRTRHGLCTPQLADGEAMSSYVTLSFLKCSKQFFWLSLLTTKKTFSFILFSSPHFSFIL